MPRRLETVAAAGALLMCIGIGTAVAGSVTQPGETVGIAAGAPLPQGLYFANTADWGCRNTDPSSCLGITIPIVTWSTPWTFLGNISGSLKGTSRVASTTSITTAS